MEYKKITFIGAGNMACAIIAGLVTSGYPTNLITASDPKPDKCDFLTNQYNIDTKKNNFLAAEQADVIVLAVKPQLMQLVGNDLRSVDWNHKLIISIVAGINNARLNEILSDSINLIRAMPNMPVLIKQGMTGLYANSNVNQSDKVFVSELMGTVGKICWVEQESDINNIIAIASSAPAYFFLFMEAMQIEAIAQGFDKNTARLLVQQSALGAIKMGFANPNIELSTLCEQITSKGGTTAEALKIFNKHQLSDIVAKAMQAVVARAEEIGKLF
ncbi:pyrroline-5-carboxylate reductase [Candidatus Photodesmus blepharus]|uniref:Pyrroline-5-carboxylate reductase n=1 Tax=Candidatus Photodesmus blepharonis TaxID=1179155 RepID=A0A084CM83_9GAMM|nr:pyrroline-5-carboxylate reductase [Candidatus Photodesmus blepharus]KEY90912.1 pyrroline-5-carboxylate reductase [Candidatus Photodesmus blepharus]